MMDEFPFGQPVDAVMQMAYFVPDVKTSMEWWTTQLGVGPWFVAERLGGNEVRYRGKPSKAEFKIALAYSGHMMIELIEALDDLPSIYKEAHEKRGYGFHHAARMVPDLQEAVATGRALGSTILHQSPTPGGGEVCFLDGGENAPGAIELIADIPATRDIFTAAWRASVDWDGSDPYRDFSEILTAAGS